jgi:hypothetical protein
MDCHFCDISRDSVLDNMMEIQRPRVPKERNGEIP